MGYFTIKRREQKSVVEAGRSAGSRSTHTHTHTHGLFTRINVRNLKYTRGPCVPVGV